MRNRAAIAVLVCVATAVLTSASWSQTPAAPAAPVETTTPTGYVPPRPAPSVPVAAPAGLSPADASRVLALLRNPAALADFQAKLEALTKATSVAGPGPVTPQPAGPPPVQGSTPAPSPGAASPGSAPGSPPGVAPTAIPAANPKSTAPATDQTPPTTPATAETPAKPGVPAGAAAAKSETEPLPLKPDSLGARLVVFGSGLLNQASAEALAALSAVRSVPLLWRWLETMATDPLAKELVLDTVWRIAAVLAAGIAVEWAVRRLIGRVLARLQVYAPAAHDDHPIAGAHRDQEAPDPEAAAEAGATEADPKHHRLRPTAWTLLRRVPFVLGRLILDMVPVAAFLVTAYAVSASGLADDRQSRLVLLAVINAYAFVGAVMAVARMILSPDYPRLRLVHMSSEDAAYSMRWLWRIVAIAVFGYAAGAVGTLLGLSPLAEKGLLKAVGFIDHVLAGVVVLQKRRAVASWIRRRAPAPNMLLAVMRSRFAAIWHWVAIFFLVATWLVWAIEVPNGYTVVVRIFAAAVAVTVGTRLVLIVLLGAIDRAMRPREAASEGPRAFGERLTVYFPLVRAIVQVVVWGVALLVLMELWGLGTLGWLVAAPLGQSILSAVVTIAVTMVVALIVWEAANARFEWHLDRLAHDGHTARATRLQTLMPMLRTALLILIGIIAGLTVLSQVGVNIGPLLAGAGIVGVAIGFGSQKLVQDLITGIFLLLENAMQVGDWVTVSGLSGSVEHLSVRTIKLRAGDGSVHIIPFSAVTTVTNTNRGLGNAPVSVTVAFSEDVDRVCDELKAIVSGMQDDAAFGAKMLSGLELWGVDKVDGSSVTIVGQIRCTDSGRYAVQREFNRRLKTRCEELSIAIYNPTVSYMIEAPHHPPAPEEPPPGEAAPPKLAGHVDAIPRAAE